MRARHTPGPWHWPHDSNQLCPVNPDPTRSSVSQILYADGGYGFMGSRPKDTLAELDADRRLIAAAPDLLEALKLADAMLSGANMNASAVQQSVRAAIAKAEAT